MYGPLTFTFFASQIYFSNVIEWYIVYIIIIFNIIFPLIFNIIELKKEKKLWITDVDTRNILTSLDIVIFSSHILQLIFAAVIYFYYHFLIFDYTVTNVLNLFRKKRYNYNHC